MSDFWYPVIDYEKCISCFACVDFCANGVFKVNSEKPKVVRPENCVSFCKGCLKAVCPTGAISFIFNEEKFKARRGLEK